MPQLLTTNAMIVCPHGGTGTSTPSSQDFSIMGGYVLVEGDQGILSCVNLPPCVGYTLRSMGLNATTVGGKKALLVTDFNQSNTGMPLTMSETHQGNDDSTAAPLPASGVATVPPELTDSTPPVVTTSTPALPFSLSAPVPVNASFNLSATYPLSWNLILLNKPLGTDIDLTNGQPPNVTVTPSGGAWDTPALAIQVAMQPPFLTALTAGEHTLYMTGVTQRGLNQYAKCIITVGP